MDTTALERREVQLTEIPINQHVTLVQMPDLVTFGLHVECDSHYVVHFLNPDVFGQEFATLRKGYNFFTMIKTEQTKCYFFDDAQLRKIVAEVEDPTMQKQMMASADVQRGGASPMTGPILIPPTKWQNNG